MSAKNMSHHSDAGGSLTQPITPLIVNPRKCRKFHFRHTKCFLNHANNSPEAAKGGPLDSEDAKVSKWDWNWGIRRYADFQLVTGVVGLAIFLYLSFPGGFTGISSSFPSL